MPMRSTIRGTAVGRSGRARRACLASVLVVALVPSLGAIVSAQPSPSPSAAEPIPTPGATQSAASSLAPSSTTAPDPGSGPAAWEYRTLFVTWDANALNWVADFSDGTRIEGLDAILNSEGANGWELVAVVPELWEQLVEGAIREDARRLRLFLKKPLG